MRSMPRRRHPWVRAIYEGKATTKSRQIGFAFTRLDDDELVTPAWDGGRHWGAICASPLVPDSKTIATGGWTRSYAFDARTLQPRPASGAHGDDPLGCVWPRTASTLVSSSSDKTIRLWDRKATPP